MILYRIGIRFYSLIVWILAKLFNHPKAILFIVGRNKKLTSKSNNNIWVHVASLGEFEQAIPLLEHIKNKTEYSLILSFYSPSGFEVKSKTKLADQVIYLPIDTKNNVNAFFKEFNPKMAVIVKYDFWWGYIDELNNRKIPFHIVSANFRKNQYLFKWYGKNFLKKLLKAKSTSTLNQESKDILLAKGAKNIDVCGDTRYDRVVSVSQKENKFKELQSFKNTYEEIAVCGSTWPEDEEIIITALKNKKGLGIIIAPHEVSKKNIKELSNKIYNNFILYSNIEKYCGEKFVIIDNIGMLSKLYSLASWAYIGGAFKTGLHNILEPLSFGVPVVFGPNHIKFPEGEEYIQLGHAKSISNDLEFTKSIQEFRPIYQNKQKLIEHINSKTGGTKVIIDKIFNT
jgi:3-deoxy-D-manno-octulosonic-acid transferase